MERRVVIGMETTPKEIDHNVLNLSKMIIGIERKPIYISVRPENYCLPLDCYGNVNKKIKKDGGKSVMGWAIWRYGNIMIEGEAHCIWKSPEGLLVDITPHQETDKEILFLSDEDLKYEGYQIDNVRLPLTDSRLVKEYISLHEDLYKLIAPYPVNTRISLTPENGLNDYKQISSRIRELHFIFHLKVGRNDPCPCGSGLKYKKCCEPYR